MAGNILILGGSGGLGQAIEEYFEDQHYKAFYGWDVVSLNSQDCDVRDVSHLRYTISEINPSILIYLPAVSIDGFLHKKSAFDIEKEVAVNATGAAVACSAALPYMREQNWGRIILASSVVVNNPVLGTSVYAATKAFQENLVSTIALENARKNITANAIRIGYMDSGLTPRIPKDLLGGIEEKIPAGGLGHSDLIGSTIDYLIHAPYTNGAVIPVTGGL